MCFGAGSVSADVGTAPEAHHVATAMAATPPSEAELPHVAEQDFLTHIPGAEIAAGGGAVIQGKANLEGEGSLEAGGTITAGASLSGSGTLIAGGAIPPAAHLAGEGHMTAGGPGVPAAQLSGSGSLTACLPDRWRRSSARLEVRAARPALRRRNHHADARHCHNVAAFREPGMGTRGGGLRDAEPLH